MFFLQCYFSRFNFVIYFYPHDHKSLVVPTIDNLTGRMICCYNNLKIKDGEGQKISCPVFMMQSIALSPVKKNNGERSSK